MSDPVYIAEAVISGIPFLIGAFLIVDTFHKWRKANEQVD